MAEVRAPAFKPVARRPLEPGAPDELDQAAAEQGEHEVWADRDRGRGPRISSPDPQPLFRGHPEGRWGRGSYCRSMANPNVALVYEVLADSVLVVPVHTVGRGAASVEDALEAARTLAGAA